MNAGLADVFGQLIVWGKKKNVMATYSHDSCNLGASQYSLFICGCF